MRIPNMRLPWQCADRLAVIAYAEDEIQKILEAEGDASGPAKKVKAPSKKRRRAPVKATKAAVQKAPKTALNRPVRSTRSSKSQISSQPPTSANQTYSYQSCHRSVCCQRR